MTHEMFSGEAGDPARGLSPRAGTALLTFAAVGGVFYLFRDLVLPLLLAALAAYLLSPAVQWAHGLGIRRTVAVTGLFAGIGLTLVAVGVVVVPRFREEALALVSNLPELAGRIERAIDIALQELRMTSALIRRFMPAADQPGWLERGIEARLREPGGVAAHLGTVALTIILVPIVSFFLLRDGGRMRVALLDRLDPAHIETTVAVWCEIDRIIGRYLRGLLLEALVVGILTAFGTWLIGVPYPYLLGGLAALLSPLPYVGSLISVATACVVVLAEGLGLAMAGWVLALYAVIRLLDDVVVIPLVIGGSVHLHPVLVVTSILAGEHLFGVVGMVLAVPTVTVMKEITRLLLEHRRTLAVPRAPRPAPAAATPFVC
jgi:predicted PurR-regulated permease PerM